MVINSLSTSDMQNPSPTSDIRMGLGEDAFSYSANEYPKLRRFTPRELISANKTSKKNSITCKTNKCYFTKITPVAFHKKFQTITYTSNDLELWNIQ